VFTSNTKSENNDHALLLYHRDCYQYL